MKIIAIKNMSVGNEKVGEMWQETKIFDDFDPIRNVIEWVGSRKKTVTLTVPENERL